MSNTATETRRAFGVLFIGIGVAVFLGAILSEWAFLYKVPVYYYAAIWLGSFGAAFGIAWPKFRGAIPAIRGRMKNSVSWPLGAKMLNALCWTGPFASIAAFPALYQYLILIGIGFGNMSTYGIMRRYNGVDNREQLLVAAISLAALPLALTTDMFLFAERQDIAVMMSRLLIALAYLVGGLYALLTKR